MESTINENPQLQAAENILRTDVQGLLKFLLSIVHSQADAEDILQAGFVRFLEKADQLKDPKKARPWVLSIFRHLALDQLREKHRDSLLFSTLVANDLEAYPDSKENLEASSICGCANRLLKKLPEPYSHILNEVEIEGASVRQLAKRLGYSSNRLSVQLHRARMALKSALKEKCKVDTYESCLECEC